MFSVKTLLLVTATAFSLAACTTPNGTPLPRTTNGALIGGLFGAVLGANARGDKSNNIIMGTAIGAAVGGLIGQQLDKQAQALRETISSRKVSIVNTGAELVVTLPESITFDTGSAVVRSSLSHDLAALARNLNAFPNTTINVVGHTDNVGPASFNQQLSAERAASVFNILVSDGVAPGRMRAFGRGERDPKASNLTARGRAQNRRVEIIIRPNS